ncbi:hypothetical protein [Algoriphagus winogradskyi]|uniref:Lipoprotein n=1 Tax=Algoriphagus winogradskyi TaxID=237017 RepID=A0ABY1NPK1_9BACT|nr:hypothetical protein [Algoriphagus winogradskyi]SMP14733.1 hypothetical protein SAMN06265367_102384 [Algoriphagus winogradskyi]
MKIFNTKLLALVTSAMLLGACSQMATYENEDLTNSLEKADQSGFKLNPYGTSSGFENAFVAFGNEIDCETAFCIPAEREGINNWGEGKNQVRVSGQNEKTVFLQMQLTVLPNNMAYYEVSGISSKTAGKAQSAVFFSGSIGVYGFGSTTEKVGNYLQEASSVNFYYKSPEFDYSEVECGDSFDFTITETSFAEDNPVIFSGTRYLYEICSEECDDESFSYSAPVIGESDVDVIFSYNYSEEAEVSIDFTFPQIINDIPTNGSYTGADGKIYRVTGNGTVFHWTGDVSCSSENPTTFAFEGLVPDCGPSTAKDGKANIWTGAKVVAINGVELVDDPGTIDINEGEYSLKGDLDNIVYSGCPITKP